MKTLCDMSLGTSGVRAGLCAFCWHAAKFPLRLEDGEMVDVCLTDFLLLTSELRHEDMEEMEEAPF